jgi:hypothetical protein
LMRAKAEDVEPIKTKRIAILNIMVLYNRLLCIKYQGGYWRVLNERETLRHTTIQSDFWFFYIQRGIICSPILCSHMLYSADGQTFWRRPFLIFPEKADENSDPLACGFAYFFVVTQETIRI